MASPGRTSSLNDRDGRHASSARFGATRWSVVLAAADDRRPTTSRDAMAELIGAYWFPLYAFLRRAGSAPQEAEDLVQGFFAELMDKRALAAVDPSKGRFRSFLLAALKHFVSKRRARGRALKRGGGRVLLSLDALDAEARYAIEPADTLTPERLFERQWALAVLQQVLARLRAAYAADGKAALYEALEPCLTAGAIDYAEAAAALDMSPAAVRTAAHRLRRRYRDGLTAEIARTVQSPGEVADEIAYLLNCL
ncbi:MAG: sigma-70 family RNA polymerase sigma factor [Planctomycetes bacterium]|nr:sigma-70 family RNA polymerase sigma factor [Planctomycetota bacterium]